MLFLNNFWSNGHIRSLEILGKLFQFSQFCTNNKSLRIGLDTDIASNDIHISIICKQRESYNSVTSYLFLWYTAFCYRDKSTLLHLKIFHLKLLQFNDQHIPNPYIQGFRKI